MQVPRVSMAGVGGRANVASGYLAQDITLKVQAGYSFGDVFGSNLRNQRTTCLNTSLQRNSC